MFVNPFQLIARWVHQISIAVVGGATFLSTLGFITIDKSNHLPVTIAGALALISGLLNAHFASPSVKNMGQDSKWWRIAIYGIKIPCFFALTPVLPKVVVDTETQNMVKFGAIMTLFLVSSVAKFFRESFLPAIPPKKQD